MEISKKSELRTWMLSKRQELDPQKEQRMNQVIYEALLALPGFSEASCVYCYVSCRHEAGTKNLLEHLWKMDRPVAVPKVDGKNMAFYYISSYYDLEPGCMGIWEPKKGCRVAECNDALVIVPGLSYDGDGYRLGYGGGYYDRFLEAEPEHITVGIGFDFQETVKVPREVWDKRLDKIFIAEETKGRWIHDIDRDRKECQGGITQSGDTWFPGEE